MIKFSLLLFAALVLFSSSFAAVAPLLAPSNPSNSSAISHPHNCHVPPLVSYCLDMMKLGSYYDVDDAGTPALDELQTDVNNIPTGSCSWVEYTGKVRVEDCLKALDEYLEKSDDEDEDDSDDNLEITDRGVFDTIKRGAKKVGRGIKKGAKKVGRGIKKGAKKVAGFCKKNKELCSTAASIGIKIITGGLGSGPDETQTQQ